MERPGSSQKSFEAYAMFDGTPGTTFRILGNTRADKSDIFAVDTSFEMGMISTRSSNSNSKYNGYDQFVFGQLNSYPRTFLLVTN